MISLLELAFTFGEVHIVTNAETGWVQLSASKFIPGVLPLLGRTKVTSARSMYENMFPQQPFKWKVSHMRTDVTFFLPNLRSSWSRFIVFPCVR